MNTLKFLTVLLSIVLFPLQSLATGDAGTNPLRTGPDTTSSECSVRAGKDCYFVFGTTALGTGVNSKVFQVEARTAVACLAASGNTLGSVRFWKVVNPIAPVTQAKSMVPSASTASTLSLPSNTDCFTMSTGRWWMEVTAITDTSDTFVVVTGSKE